MYRGIGKKMYANFLARVTSEPDNEETMQAEAKTFHLAPNGEHVTIYSRIFEMDFDSVDSSNPDKIQIYIHVSYMNGDMSILASKDSTVGEIKSLIYAITNIAPEEQLLTGWLENPASDTVLSALNLSNIVYLNLNKIVGSQHENTLMGIDNSNHLLRIYEPVRNIEYFMMFPGCTKISQLKTYLFIKTGIPEQKQIWCGWPEGVTDESKLGEIEMELPVQCLILHSTDIVEETLHLQNSINQTDTASSSRHADDSVVTPLDLRTHCLIPDNVDSDLEGAVRFITAYIKRYGEAGPVFYAGTLEDAIQEASPRRRNQILAIYLHHGGSVLTNTVCSQLLAHEAVIKAFQNKFLLWGCDITNQRNKERLLLSTTKLLGTKYTQIIQNFTVEHLPVLMLFSSGHLKSELLDMIYGDALINELVPRLNSTVALFSHIQSEDKKAYLADSKRHKAKKKQKRLLHLQNEEKLKNEGRGDEGSNKKGDT